VLVLNVHALYILQMYQLTDSDIEQQWQIAFMKRYKTNHKCGTLDNVFATKTN